MMYIVEVEYRNENERKRLDYIVTKWNNAIRKPNGYVLQINDEGAFQEILGEISSKFPQELIRVFKAEEIKLKPEKVNDTRVYTVNKGVQETKTFLNFLVARNRGIFIGKTGDAEIYDIYTRKGIVRTYITLRQSQNGTYVRIEYSGTGDAVSKLVEEIDREIRIFGEAP